MHSSQNLFSVYQKILGYAVLIFVNIRVPKNWELQQIVFDQSSDVKSKDATYIYKEYTAKPYPFFVIDITILTNNPLHLRKNFLERI